MDQLSQTWQYALMRMALSRHADDERGEIRRDDGGLGRRPRPRRDRGVGDPRRQDHGQGQLDRLRMIRPAALRRDDRGDASVQHLVLVPVMFVCCLLSVQAGLWFHTANVAASAASRGALAGSGRDASTAAALAAVTAAVADNGGALVGAPAVTRNATEVAVTVELSVVQLLPFGPGSVRRTASAPVERFVPEDER